MIRGVESSPWLADILGKRSSPLWVRVVTTPASWFMALVMSARLALYSIGCLRTRSLPGRVISVGNITVGGTGKSPTTVLIARELIARGARPAILSRGYRSGLKKSEGVALVAGRDLFGRDVAKLALDEAKMQSAALPDVPVLAGARRHALATRFLRQFPERAPSHWILDDGFQHRGIMRDIDIVLLDFTKPFGNGHVLPRGDLREPLRGLRRASLVVVTRVPDEESKIKAERLIRIAYDGPMMFARFDSGGLVPLMSGDVAAASFESEAHNPALVVTGIARPDNLLDQLRAAGVAVGNVYAVPDHHRFDPSELAKRAAGARSVVTTAKDYWRDPSIFAGLATPVFVHELAVRLDGESLAEHLR